MEDLFTVWYSAYLLYLCMIVLSFALFGISIFGQTSKTHNSKFEFLLSSFLFPFSHVKTWKHITFLQGKLQDNNRHHTSSSDNLLVSVYLLTVLLTTLTTRTDYLIPFYRKNSKRITVLNTEHLQNRATSNCIQNHRAKPCMSKVLLSTKESSIITNHSITISRTPTTWWFRQIFIHLLLRW